MRRILVESTRRKMAINRGGGLERVTWDEQAFETEVPPDEILAVHEALKILNEDQPELARIAVMRYFAGMTVVEVASSLDVSESTVERQWRAARAWLHREITETS